MSDFDCIECAKAEQRALRAQRALARQLALSTKSVRLSDAERDELADHIPYCSTCVMERGDSGLGWCKKHMDPALRTIIAARKGLAR